MRKRHRRNSIHELVRLVRLHAAALHGAFTLSDTHSRRLHSSSDPSISDAWCSIRPEPSWARAGGTFCGREKSPHHAIDAWRRVVSSMDDLRKRFSYALDLVEVAEVLTRALA